MHDIA